MKTKKNFMCLMIIMGTIVSMTQVYALNYYELKMHYSDGRILLNTVSVKPLATTQTMYNLPGYYVVQVVSDNEEVLNTTLIDIPKIELYDSFDFQTGSATFGGEQTLSEVDFDIKLPYFENGQKIRIYALEEGQKFEFDVSEFSKSPAYREIQEYQDKPPLPQEVGTFKEEPTRFLLGILLLVLAGALIIWYHAKTNKKQIKKPL